MKQVVNIRNSVLSSFLALSSSKSLQVLVSFRYDIVSQHMYAASARKDCKLVCRRRQTPNMVIYGATSRGQSALDVGYFYPSGCRRSTTSQTTPIAPGEHHFVWKQNHVSAHAQLTVSNT
jgi:hypothetical protein